MKLWKTITLWIVSVLLMVIVSKYQTMTGPTYPESGSVVVGGYTMKFSLPRSHGGDGNEIIKLYMPDQAVEGKMKFKRYRSNDEWQIQHFTRMGDTIVAEIPHQPPAGKVMYEIFLRDESDIEYALTPGPVIIRFRGDVPVFVLVLHIIFMFAAMCLSTRTAFEAIFKGKGTYKMTIWTILLLIVGGFILGPLVQKYAFDTYWTGWPFGGDLTDNKTLVALVFWVIAYWRIRKNQENKLWPIIAAAMMIIVFLIPHSVLGSEIDYTKMPQQ